VGCLFTCLCWGGMTAHGQEFAGALEAVGQSFATMPGAPWIVQAVETSDGQDAVESASLHTRQGVTWLETTIVGPGDWSFMWKAPGRMSGFDCGDAVSATLTPTDGGTPVWTKTIECGTGQFPIENESWQKVSLRVPTGSFVLRWTATTLYHMSAQPLRLWVDQLSGNGDQNAVFNEALDTVQVGWTYTGTWGLVPEGINGGDSLRSLGVEATLSLSIEGPGVLVFFWRFGGYRFDQCGFTVDGSPKFLWGFQAGYAFGERFVPYAVELPPGPHELKWFVGGQAATFRLDSVSLLPKRHLSHWLATHFSSSERNEPTVSGPQADPDRDGLNNLIEYAYNDNPRTFSASRLRPGKSGVLPVDYSAVDADFSFEISSDHKTWERFQLYDVNTTEPAHEALPVTEVDGAHIYYDMERAFAFAGFTRDRFARVRITATTPW
jgi:hypothetical protein